MSKLTTRFCDEVTTDKRHEFPDGGGLYLGVMETGYKSWSFRFRFNGVNSRAVIGSYPEISLYEARRKLKELKKILAEGKDPAEYARRSFIVEYTRARWIHPGCGAFINMMPQNVRMEVVEAALDAIRCPHCGKGPKGIRLAQQPRKIIRHAQKRSLDARTSSTA